MKDITIQVEGKYVKLTTNTPRGVERIDKLSALQPPWTPSGTPPDWVAPDKLPEPSPGNVSIGFSIEHLPRVLTELTDYHSSRSGNLDLQGLGVPEMIDIADIAFPDGMCRQYLDEPDQQHGDTLCEFIAIEVSETNDSTLTISEQFEEAARVMRNGASELTNVAEQFERLASATATE